MTCQSRPATCPPTTPKLVWPTTCQPTTPKLVWPTTCPPTSRLMWPTTCPPTSRLMWPTTTTTPEPSASGSGFAPAAEGQVLESTGDSNNDANGSDDTSGFEKYKLPLIIVGSVLSGVLATLGAVAGIKFSHRNAASKSNYADMQNAESVV